MIDLKPLRKKYGRLNGRRRLARCLNIARRLQAGLVYVPTLADNYGVDQRSIQRDLRELAAAGFVVERGEVKGWWRTK